MSLVQQPRRTSRGSLSQSARPTGIEKSRSIQSSPRVLDRRRMTISSKHYGGLEDHYRFMFGDDQGAVILHPPTGLASSRPLSWHPSTNPDRTAASLGFLANGAYSHQQEGGNSSTDSANISNLTNENLDLLQQEDQMRTRGGQSYIDSWRHACLSPEESQHPRSAVETPSFSSYTWNRPSHETAAFVQPRSHPRDDCHPIPHQNDLGRSASTRPFLSRKPSNELIGMGLYDSPTAVASFFSDMHSTTGKGLKLAESFEPAPSSDDGDSEMADADDNDNNRVSAEIDASGSTASDPSLAELEQKTTLTPNDVSGRSRTPMAALAPMHAMAGMQKLQENPLQPALQQLATGGMAGNLSGRSFFFDEEDMVVTADGVKAGMAGAEWWEGHLRNWQPAVAASGYGIGWLGGGNGV